LLWRISAKKYIGRFFALEGIVALLIIMQRMQSVNSSQRKQAYYFDALRSWCLERQAALMISFCSLRCRYAISRKGERSFLKRGKTLIILIHAI
jgi:hypothetical protein